MNQSLKRGLILILIALVIFGVLYFTSQPSDEAPIQTAVPDVSAEISADLTDTLEETRRMLLSWTKTAAIRRKRTLLCICINTVICPQTLLPRKRLRHSAGAAVLWSPMLPVNASAGHSSAITRVCFPRHPEESIQSATSIRLAKASEGQSVLCFPTMG